MRSTNLINNKSIRYHFDQNNQLIGLNYSGKEYVYARNLLGEIYGIMDLKGKSIIRYTYNAYGVPSITLGTNLSSSETLIASDIAELNIYLYKGYIYDQETKLYYCKSRYYDPEVGRWLSIDHIAYLDVESIGGLNLYAYCGNNPIMYSDPNGKFPILALAIISGILILGGGALGGISAHQNNTDIIEGIGKGLLVGTLLSGSIVLTVGSFYVTGGLGSNLGLMMLTYGYNTAMNMLEVGVTQARYSTAKGDVWFSNIINAMYSNSGGIYGQKAIPKALPFAQDFTWHIGERYEYTIPDTGGVFYDYHDTKEAWGIFNQFLRARPSKLSYLTSIAFAGLSTYGLGNAIFGTPNYGRWVLY